MSIFKNNIFYIFCLICLLFGIFFNYFFLFFFLGAIFFLIFKITSKYFFFIISIIFITFFFFEIFFQDEILKSDYLTKNNITYEVNNNYGYHPTKNQIFDEEIFYKKKLVKKNTYTIDKYGHRKINNRPKLKNCLIFHGGSITFGQSLSDNETLPYLASQFYKEEFNTFNFAFNGYGPHQFLAKLDDLNQEEVKHCENVIIFYQFIYDHIARTAGKRSWGDKSPRFILKNNKLENKGFFSEFPFKIIMKLRKNFRHSKISNILFNLESISQNDKIIFLEIIKNIEIYAKKNFSNVEFIYLVWDKDMILDQELFSFFNSANSIYIDELNIDKNYLKNNIPGDNHPTKEFNLILINEIKKKLKL